MATKTDLLNAMNRRDLLSLASNAELAVRKKAPKGELVDVLNRSRRITKSELASATVSNVVVSAPVRTSKRRAARKSASVKAAARRRSPRRARTAKASRSRRKVNRRRR